MDKRVYLTSASALLASAIVASAASAETTTARAPEISVVAAAPKGFDVMKASPEMRARYALPPAPDASAAPEAYQEWVAAVASPTLRETPKLQPTNIFNGPNRVMGKPVKFATANSVSATSGNWSGSSIVNSSNPFSTEAIIGAYVVPTAHQAFGSCTGGWDYSSQWPGIDGNGSNDVLQAGTEVDAYCNGSTKSAFYSAWIEWYPFSETRVSSPAVSPGDYMFVEVWNTSPSVGYAYFFNYSTRVAAEYKLTAPSGTTLKGNSVEWIVERPGVGGGLATLTNYIDVSWPRGVAWNYAASTKTYYYQAQNPAAGTLEFIKMLDNSGNGISASTVENGNFQFFQDFGSACGVSGAPPC